jgi:hypothetical protein
MLRNAIALREQDGRSTRRQDIANVEALEAEEDCTEVGFGPFTGIWLELRQDVDEEGEADCREQAGLGTQSKMWGDDRSTETKAVLRSSLCFCMYSVSYCRAWGHRS